MSKRRIGTTGGVVVEEVTLESSEAAVTIMGYGASIRDWRVDGPNGTLPVVLGFPHLEDYVTYARAHGAVCGRIANRVRDGQFMLDGTPIQLSRNHGSHHLHGGVIGLQRRVWRSEPDAQAEAVHLHYASPDKEEGYPGAVAFGLTYRLEGAKLICEMTGVPDRRTPVSLAHHAYYNLNGSGDVRDHVLQSAVTAFTPIGDDELTTGEIRPVRDTRLDYARPRALREADPRGAGHDDNLVLDPDRDRAAPAAIAHSPSSGLWLRLWTDQPGLQVYDGAGVTLPAPGHDRVRYGSFAGLCLEAQNFPDAVNKPDWPEVIVSPDLPYFQRLEVEISRDGEFLGADAPD